MCKTLRLSDSCWCYFSQKLNDKLNDRRLKRDDDYQTMQRVILKNIFLVVTRSTNTRTDLQKKKKKKNENKKLIVDSRQQPPRVFTSGPNICLHFVYRFILAQTAFKHEQTLKTWICSSDLRLSPNVWSETL